MPTFFRIVKYLLPTLFFVALASCSSSGPLRRALARAESLMDGHPDSALVILQSVPPDALGSGSERALYGLLMTQALHKNYIDITSDSLISPAVKFYENSGDKERLLKALYYSAQIDYNRKAYTESLITLFQAYELASQLDDKFWIGLSAQRICDVYHYNHCVDEEQRFAKITLDNFRQTGRTGFIDDALYAIARSYHCAEDYDTSIQIATGLIDSAHIHNDINLNDKAWELIGLGKLAIKDYDGACEAFHENFKSPYATAADSAHYSVLCLKSGRVNEAQDIIRKLLDSSNLPVHLDHWVRYNYYESLDSVSRSHEMLDAMRLDTDSVLKYARRSNLAGSIVEYYSYKSSLDRERLKLSRVYTLIVILLALIAIGTVTAYVRRRHRRQQIIIEEYIEMCNDLKLVISKSVPAKTQETEDGASSVSQSPLFLLEKYFSEFDTLCKGFRKDESAAARQKLIDYVNHITDSFGNDALILRELENYANIRYDGVMKKLRADFPNLKEMDYQIFLFSRLGFSISTIALCLNKDDNKTAIYNRRKRLREKFREFSGLNRMLYIEVFP